MLLRTGKTTLTETLRTTRTYVLTLSPRTMEGQKKRGRPSKKQQEEEKRKAVAAAAAAAAVERQAAAAAGDQQRQDVEDTSKC